MWGRRMDALERVVERTAAQLGQLTTAVADLTSLVKVGAAKHDELERRIGVTETRLGNIETGGTQKSLSREMVLYTALVSMATSGVGSLVLHFILGGK